MRYRLVIRQTKQDFGVEEPEDMFMDSVTVNSLKAAKKHAVSLCVGKKSALVMQGKGRDMVIATTDKNNKTCHVTVWECLGR